ncbi:glucose-1-phosphate thymidylyltransferase [Clostridia bacterium]|nr:glucose-1-phosphate thymidylyltransferase [Clostridia bacterium]
MHIELKQAFSFESDEIIKRELFERVTYPWEVLELLGFFILQVGNTLSSDFEEIEKNVWVHKTAKIDKSAKIAGPVIIRRNCEIRHCALVRSNMIIGENSIIGSSTEVKNSIFYNNVQVAHFNYVGDSILGNCVHLGAGAIISNMRGDKKNIIVNYGNEKLDTNLRKFGAIVGDNTEIGCNAVLNPGTILGNDCAVYPLTMVRGYVKSNSICKNTGEIIEKK